MHLQIGFDRPNIAADWIARGANVNGQDKTNLETPLHKTAYKGN